MNAKSVIKIASRHLARLPGRSFDIFNIAKPSNLEAAVDLAKLHKIVSKLSPLVGNLIEHDTAKFLNSFNDYAKHGRWVRQDPGFPDIILDGNIVPKPGFEIKAWYPFSTEITGRFKDSQNHFENDQTYVILLVWLPEYVIYGKPLLFDMLITSGISVAKSRDNHYHNPPDYLVLEPEDTSRRTDNLQQTNTNGYKFQLNRGKFIEAQKVVASWGRRGKMYRPTPHYQHKLRTLMARYKYRLDTNYAKMDRINHDGIEKFKVAVMDKSFHGMPIKNWLDIFSKGNNRMLMDVLAKHLHFKKVPNF